MPNLTWPSTVYPLGFSLTCNPSTRGFTGLTGVAETPTDLGDDLWSATVTVDATQGRQAALVETLSNRLAGALNTVDIYHFARPVPRGTARVSRGILVDGSKDARELQVILEPLATLEPGDMLGAGGLLLQVAERAIADSAGGCTVKLVNRLRKPLQGHRRGLVAYAADTATQSYVQYSADSLRVQDGAYLWESASTNWCLNSSWAGAATGVTPTGLANLAGTSANVPGMTWSVAGIGTESGLPYVDIRYQGTPANTGVVAAHTMNTADNYLPVAAGQSFTSGVFARLVAGSSSRVTFYLRHQLRDAAKAAVVTQDSASLPLGGVSLFASRHTHTINVTNPLVAFVFVQLRVSLTDTAPKDFTLRYAVPQLELGSSLSSPILTSAGPVTRPADVTQPVTLDRPTARFFAKNTSANQHGLTALAAKTFNLLEYIV